MSTLKWSMAACLLVMMGAASVHASGHCDGPYEWRFRKYGGGYNYNSYGGPGGNCYWNGSNYCSPYQGWFGSPYYGGFNGAKWNRYGWGYDGLGTHGR